MQEKPTNATEAHQRCLHHPKEVLFLRSRLEYTGSSMTNAHHYELSVKWTGNRGDGTKDYRSYDRAHLITAPGKPDLVGSSDPKFRGDPTRWNPEELLLASLSACHMLWYLHLCSEQKIIVMEYVDRPIGEMIVEASGLGRFKEATMRPVIVITDAARIADAEKLHAEAHKKCFIANSVNFPVKVESSIKT